jgi:diguanylate cyclase (GGDEF)-like protein
VTEPGEAEPQPRRRWSFAGGGFSLAAGAVTGLLIIVAAWLLTWQAAEQRHASRRLGELATELSIGSDDVIHVLLTAENGQRGFLLTGREAFLEPYCRAQSQAPATYESLDQLSATDPRHREQLQELKRLTQARLADLAAVLELRQARGAAAAAAAFTATGSHTMQRIRVLDRHLSEAAEEQAAVQEQISEQAAARARQVSGGAALLLTALLGSMLVLLAQRGRLRQRKAEVEQERAELIEQLSHQVNHDPLTGLPNRRLLEDRVRQALVRSERDRTLIALFFIDVDRFKSINDSQGHAVGDKVLTGVAHQLRAQLRSTDTLARVGGDEFVALYENVRSSAEADELGQRLEAVLRRGLDVAGQSIVVTASIGFVVAEHDRIHGAPLPQPLNPEVLIAAADAAMYDAKTTGRARRQEYNPLAARALTDRSTLQTDLANALSQGQLWVAYQPLVELDSGKPVGVEALLRWDHPSRGPVSPGTFIPLAEESGLIVAIGTFVLRQTCAQVASWNAERRCVGLPALGASVNCSARQLLDARFLEEVARALTDSGLPPELLTLEITESVLIDSVAGASDSLERIAATGVKLSLDDFGTGYSSLSYLRRFPVDLIKIDRSFVSGLGRSDADEAIISAVVSLADRLDRRVLAEGIETPDQAGHVARLGCHLGQGYLFGRPAPARDLQDRLVPRGQPALPGPRRETPH